MRNSRQTPARLTDDCSPGYSTSPPILLPRCTDSHPNAPSHASPYTGWRPPCRSTLDPQSFRGEQCAEARLGRRRSDPAVACRCSRQFRAGRWPHCRASWFPSAARAASSNTLRRPSGVVVPGCRMPTMPCSPCPRPRVQRPASRGCSASACPVSARLVSDARCRCPGSRALCPTSDVRCPASGNSGIVKREAAAGSLHASGQAGSASHPTVCKAAGARRFAHCGRLRAGRQERAAGGRPRPESLAVGRPRWEALWSTARVCAVPPRPKAAGGLSPAVRPGGETPI
jgi:hypothetical protein